MNADHPHDDEGPVAYQNITIETFDDGSALVRTETNDNLDQGIPNEYAFWEHHWKSADAAIKSAGVSRIGISGVRVRVYLNGEEHLVD